MFCLSCDHICTSRSSTKPRITAIAGARLPIQPLQRTGSQSPIIFLIIHLSPWFWIRSPIARVRLRNSCHRRSRANRLTLPSSTEHFPRGSNGRLCPPPFYHSPRPCCCPQTAPHPPDRS
uniref:Uncharacterized protein n=1 Tax=Arundo donax TaxID=35708 RepID=A0A0A9HVQ7_ARUDO